ncbi:deaminase [Calidifontibacter sp. DB0510]|uniref:Deaminase n=1 Tax=Metallococcus carri TaxID=1656884 RepID=A0A967B1S9_9MICO|nr:dihydrofolate reductase family protein [Metallococcus carri]NHN55720.1 deaminase [Metallococcus carri]NOP38591.1 deaminase [Calidifontibacter sp. DB2511S]
MPTRPRLIVSLTPSLDGRIALNRATRLLQPEIHEAWRQGWSDEVEPLQRRVAAWIEQTYAPTVLLEGSGSFVADDAPPLDLPVDRPREELLTDHLPGRAPRRWFAVVDGRGRVPWEFFGDDDTRLIVIACRTTPLGYLADLRRRAVPYLIAGDERVDLTQLPGVLADRLGAQCIVSEGGGGLNGALLRAGLVDEVNLVIAPMVVGGRGTPATFDGEPLADGIPATAMRLEHVEREGDALWLRYLRK